MSPFQLSYYDGFALTDQKQSVVVNNLVEAYLKSEFTGDYRVNPVTFSLPNDIYSTILISTVSASHWFTCIMTAAHPIKIDCIIKKINQVSTLTFKLRILKAYPHYTKII